MQILLAVPTRADLHPDLRRRCEALVQQVISSNPGMVFDVAVYEDTTPYQGDPADTQARYGHIAQVRNALLDAHLHEGHEYVFWVDADLVDYSPRLPTILYQLNPLGITAPAILLEGDPSRFYDLAGFIECGRWAGMFPPHFDQGGPLIDLDSVGCCYIAPASLYRSGVRYAMTRGYTEHYAVCQVARAQGLRVRCLTAEVAWHADIRRYQ